MLGMARKVGRQMSDLHKKKEQFYAPYSDTRLFLKGQGHTVYI
jgi:hypothetical protein